MRNKATTLEVIPLFPRSDTLLPPSDDQPCAFGEAGENLNLLAVGPPALDLTNTHLPVFQN